MTTPTLHDLIQQLPQTGRLDWIGLRPGRGEPMTSVSKAAVVVGHGLEGDRFKGRPQSKRQVTLIQAEHLPAIGSLLHRAAPEPGLIRRNLVVSGLNLLALKNRTFRIGDVVLEMTGLCHPCSKMETLFGPGGYNALRGHGGINARVLEGGLLWVNDTVVAL
ncbi:MOSC domain-containing protein [Marinobacter caseinilyticus]|uniref:MOSC domain-containing protein n=1 Tax=Marinobacter caseinilyticus TaxID=2692195 RepID=UPI001408E635|nr:MOSC domain-containing protein [Marinobacter caseinilyticus]